MPRPIHVEVDVRETRGDQNKMIKKFIKKVKKSGILNLYREKSRFEKPSDKRRRERLKKRQNAIKAENLRKKKA